MESLSRPFHRRKPSNANAFSGKNAYDGVFSGHRPNYDGAPAVNVDDYREIFSTSGASIPVIDLSNLEESSGELNSEVRSTSPDYGRIFGGFRDLDIAISYEELVARDTARDPSSTSQGSQDSGDMSHQTSDALKQFNLSYNKISQRSKDGLDGTTHVTQLHAVNGFTCFVDESASQTNKETVKQKASSSNNVNVNSATNNVNVNSSEREVPEKQTATNNVNVNSSNRDVPEKQTATNNVNVNSSNRDVPEKQTSINNVNVNVNSSKHGVPEKQIATNNVNVNSSKRDAPEKQATINNVNVNSSKREVPEKQTAINNVNVNSSKREVPEKQTAINNINVNSSKLDAPEKQTTINNVNVNSSKRGVPEKQTATNNVNVNSSNRDVPEKRAATNNVNVNSKVLSSPEAKKETKKQKPPATNIVPSSLPAASQPKKETEKQKPPETNNVPSSPPAASQPKKETEKQKFSVTNNVRPSEKVDFPVKQTSQTAIKSQSGYGQDEAFSNNKNFKTFQADFKSYPSKVSSSHAASTTNLDNHKSYQKRSTTTNEEFPPSLDEEVVVNSAAAALKKAIEKAQESIRIAKESVGRKKEGLKGFSSKSFKDSLKVKARVANVYAGEEDKEKDDKMKDRDHKNGNFSDGEKLFAPKKVINEIHGKVSESVKISEIPVTSRFELNDNKMVCNSKQVVEEHKEKDDKTKERDHKNGNFSDSEKLFGPKKVINEIHGKVSESVKISEIPVTSFELNDNKMVCNSKQVVEEHKGKDDKVKERDHKNGNFFDGEKLFGPKKVITEIHGKVSESVKISEIPVTSRFELNDNKMVCQSKQVGETETKSGENNACENPQKDDKRPDGFLVLESCETKQEDIESNNLTLCQKAETKKEISQTSDQNGYEKKFSEESFGLLENNVQENLEHEHDHKVATAERQDEDEDERQVKGDGGTEIHSEEEKFYDSSQREDYENHEAEEAYENSSSDYDDAEENDNATGTSNMDDTEKACKVDQNVNNAEICQEIDDVSSRREFQVENTEAVEKEAFENMSSDETEENKNEHEEKSDHLENCGLADVDFAQNGVQLESSLDSIHGMEIEVKEYKEREETVEKEENNFQESREQTPEIRIEMDTGTPQEPKDAHREPEPSEPSRAAHHKEEMERERIKLAVDRAIREARERAFAEVRQRVIADTQEKVTKASIDKTSAQSKLKAERALVERATAEARQRALEKYEKQTSSASQTNTESALRSKAKLEKHNRIMERAAKALAEKEKRDLLVLREQAERNRLAEYLDADIKRWSTGKEGNLRALLSTLQYILGADSGWQAVSLTEIITTSAVKKAYRKATLCVHPDKLQQRGASIQQKYICEKVFDLLKAAWNRFNSEER